MSDFAGMEELLQDFLLESADLLADVDNKLVELERRADDRALLNDIFRGFHTIKGGAGFLGAQALVNLCHATENLFDKLRTGGIKLSAGLMDTILAATAAVRPMFDALSHAMQPQPADPELLDALHRAADGDPAPAVPAAPATPRPAAAAIAGEPDWNAYYRAVVAGGIETPASSEAAPVSAPPQTTAPVSHAQDAEPMPVARRDADKPAAAGKETTIRVDTVRLDNVLTLSGEIGLIKNRLTSLRTGILHGDSGADTLRALDDAVSQLDLLVGNLQNAVMKTRMQPIGRLFLKYPRLARDLARQLGKDVELVLAGEATEIDKTMLEDLNDPLVHLIRNAVDHGVELPAERAAMGKPPKSMIELSARQEGDHIVIEIADDGRGMVPEVIRRKAVDKGLITQEEANALDDRQALNLIFLPGFSTKAEISDVSGRGVGMDVVKTNIRRLNGTIDIRSKPGSGSTISISLPLTLAIMPVLVVRLGNQPFAVPLSLVREILPLGSDRLQHVTGKSTIVVRGDVLPVLPLAGLIGWPTVNAPAGGVLMQVAEVSFVLGIDGFIGRDDVVIKSLDVFKPKGVAGVTMSSEGEIVLILDIGELLNDPQWGTQGVTRAISVNMPAYEQAPAEIA
jgi:two-component system, chemotaxis family, sensor kinase CheA